MVRKSTFSYGDEEIPRGFQADYRCWSTEESFLERDDLTPAEWSLASADLFPERKRRGADCRRGSQTGRSAGEPKGTTGKRRSPRH